nr:methyltransferase [Shimwellia pseudoproteus]
MLSGDWVPAGQPAQLHQLRPDCRVIALGGATEAAIWSCFHEVPAGSHYDGSIPYGRPLPGQQMWVVNDDLEPAVTGQIGQIVIGGAAVSAGYLGADNAAFITLSDGITPGFITGDLGRYLANGEIEFLGRRDSQIKRHGYRIEPGEITALLREHPNVGDAAVVMAPRQQLVAVVTPGGASTACREADKQAAEAVEHQHLQWLSRLDAPRFTALMARMELAALVAMQDLRQRQVAVHADYLPLMARWDRMLQRKAPLLAPFNGDISFSLAERLWQQARDLAREMDYGDGQLDYIARCLQQLEQVAAGEVDPLALLFPEGRTDVALASYGENFINRYLNQLIVAGVDARARQAAAQQRPLRILEIGAGVGGTTGPVLDCLRGYQQHQGLRVDYCFTDVSRFFLDEAASRWPDITTRRCDINQDFAAQGFAPGQWDIVLCANVLHNARHIPRALARIHPLLAPGGDLAIIDAVRPSAPLMITMEFKEGLSDFQDQRAEDGEAFYPRECWQQALAASPFRHSIMLPGVTDGAHPAALAISNIHQSVIWASAGYSTPRPDTAQLHDTLRQRLPGYMLPDRILVLDTLPLTANGKVDHKTLLATLPAVTQGAETEEAISGEATDSIAATVPSLDASQRAVAVIWAGVLGITDPDSLHPGSDFFTAGGDSLLLAKCVGALRRGIPGAAAISWDDLLRQMVADPRLENCARLVWHPQAAECDSLAPPADSGGGLQTLLPAASATATERHGEALCLIHDGSGGLAPYHALIAALAGLDERPEVIGISRSPGDQYLTLAPETLFDALADRYVQALGARPLRRVYLFGYCMGGLLAAAMAEKLTAAGIDVRQLIVVSAYRLPFTMEDDLLLDYSLARLLNQEPADIGLDLPEQPLGALITLARETWQQHIPQGAVAALAPQFPAIATALSQAPAECQQRLARLAACAGLDPATLSALRAVYVASLRATGAFNRPGYLGDITFLRQRGDIHFLPTLKEDMTRFWRDYCLGTLTITDIAGNHFDCLEGDGARSVAALLRGIWA